MSGRILAFLAALPLAFILAGPVSAETDEISPDGIRAFVSRNALPATSSENDRMRFGTVVLLGNLLHQEGGADFSKVRSRVGEDAYDRFLSAAPVKNTELWSQFMQGATVLIGRGLSDRPVLGFYNALVDGFIVLSLERREDKLFVLDMVAITGQSLRGAAHVTRPTVTRLPSPILANYALSAQAFNKLYPADARAKSPVQFDDNAAQSSVEILKRSGMLKAQKTAITKNAALTGLLEDFTEAAAESDVARLQGLFPADTVSPPEWVANVPAALRKDLTLLAAFRKEAGYQFVLASPAASRFVVLLDAQDSGEKPGFTNIILGDYAKLNGVN